MLKLSHISLVHWSYVKEISLSLLTTFYISYNSEQKTLPSSFQSSPQDLKRAKLKNANKADLSPKLFIVLYMYIL